MEKKLLHFIINIRIDHVAFDMWATDVNCLFHIQLSIYVFGYIVKQSSTHPLLPQNHIQMRMVSIVYVTVCALLATIADGTASTTISTAIVLTDVQNCEGRAVNEFAKSMPFLTVSPSKIEFSSASHFLSPTAICCSTSQTTSQLKLQSILHY